jgi:serine/threonine protein phosphatase 1
MIAVIGDVHGCFYTFQSLVEKVKQKYPHISVYCVGDLVDRGNHSYEVLEYVISENIQFTPGNHDYMFYSYMKEPNSEMAKAWLYNGSDATLRSYEHRMDKIEEHINLIKQAPLFFNTNDCFISHAGISAFYKNKLPDNILDNLDLLENIMQSDLYNQHSIIWTRDPLINIGKLQVVGHTRKQDIYHNAKSNSLYIDTAAVANNKLTSVVLDNNNIIEIISEETDPSDSFATSF